MTLMIVVAAIVIIMMIIIAYLAYTSGYETGVKDQYPPAYERGYQKGYEAGKDVGYRCGLEEVQDGCIDMRPIMQAVKRMAYAANGMRSMSISLSPSNDEEGEE